MPGTDRRNSTSSEDANAPPTPTRQLSQDGSEIIPTRMSKVTAPKPASNPLQFIKVGPCDLYKAAQEQIKKVEEIKKVEKVKDESEDWQSNLDNWKCSRRKRQEHIIERVVEVKKMELEEHDRNRRRSKTFNEMMEERSSKGGIRKMSILSYPEEDSNDLSDLGIGMPNASDKSTEDFHENEMNGLDNNKYHGDNGNGCNGSNGHNGHRGMHDDESSTPATTSSPEPEEYTYERAIQGYMNFAEAKIKTPVKNINENKGLNGNVRISPPRKETGSKIGEKLSELEQIRLRSKSTNDINGSSEGKQLPKVDINKRRSLFENAEAGDSGSKSAEKIPKDLSSSQTIKDRLSSLEKQKSTEKRLSNGEILPQISIKERLNSLEKQKESDVKNRSSTDDLQSVSIKERVSNLDSAFHKDVTAKVMPERDVTFRDKLESFKSTEKFQNEFVNNNINNNCSESKGMNRSLERLDDEETSLDRVQNMEEEEDEDEDEDEDEERCGTAEASLISNSQSNVQNNNKPEGDFGEKNLLEGPPVSSAAEVEDSVSTVELVEEMSDNETDVVDNKTDAKTDVKENERNKETESQEVASTGEADAVDVVPETETGLVEENASKEVEVVEESAENLIEMVKDVAKPQAVIDGLQTTVRVVVEKSPGEGLSEETTPNNISETNASPIKTETETIVTEISLPPDGEGVAISVSVDSAEDDDDDEEESAEVHPKSSLPKPKTRVRKLTPILAKPKKCISPAKTICELQIIEEGDVSAPAPEETSGEPKTEKLISVQMGPRVLSSDTSNSNEVQDLHKAHDVMNMDEPEEDALAYTDENIDEVLGKDDEELETPVDDEAVTRFDLPMEEVREQKETRIDLEMEKKAENLSEKPRTPKQGYENIEKQRVAMPCFENLEKQRTMPGYENIIIANQMPKLSSPSGDVEMVTGLSFGTPSSIQPPKEKPPPPPLELSDEESTTPELPPKPSLRRLDSTKRIKKEIRKKRSDFLGIEGSNDDIYLESDIYVAPPPDMITFLQEERRLEQQLYRQSICSESDSNHETAESRDSGVELDRGHVDDICWSKQPLSPDVLSEPHSRQNSETFGNTSITSEEDEILKKEREIIEVLEKEEQWRYGNKNSNSTEQNDIGEKLAVKLRQLEQEKMQLEWQRAEEEGRRQAEETARREDEERLKAKEKQLREQESCASNSNTDSTTRQEALRSERERLQKEQEELERCRQKLIKQQQNNSDQLEIHHRGWDTPSTRHSLQEVPLGVPMQDVPRRSMQDVSQQQYPQPMTSSYRYSLPDLQQRDTRLPRPPPPIPPAKPLRERETNIRNSRIPSADNIPQQIEAVKLRHGTSMPAHMNHGGQQMSRSTLHALSATPRSRLITNENWMQPKRKTDGPKNTYNYQHWLIQEAEHRRIVEQQQRVSNQVQSRRSLPPHLPNSGSNYTAPSHHTVGLPLTPPSHTHQHHGQSQHKWVSPPRTDKPLPDAVIQTLTQRVQNRENKTPPRRRLEMPTSPQHSKPPPSSNHEGHAQVNNSDSQERMLSVSGKKKCSHCNEELGRGAAMIIESLRLFYHIDCFKCCVCHVQLGDGLMGTDVRVRNNKLHCHNCYSSDDGVKFSCV